MNNLTHLDLFSGIGGFGIGLKQAGLPITNTYYSEVDKHAIANYRHNNKDNQYVGSVSDVHGSSLGRINIITFGSPCQDFSIAGTRKGMEGERSSLISEAIRLIDECRPDVFIWENVKGAFSSNARKDFWAIIKAFADLGGYRLEWQLLNTAWFLPQNRERIYLVGTLGNKSGGQIFPIREEVKRIDERSEQTKIAGCLTAGGNSGGLHSSMTLIKQRARGFNKGGTHEVCPTITGRSFHHKNHVVVKPVLTPDRENKRQNGRRFKEDGEPAFTLTAQDRHGVMISGITMKRTDEGKRLRKKYETGEIEHGFNEHREPSLRKDGLTNTLDTSQKSRNIGIEEKDLGTTIRRLTEIECERLQGFPDNFTKFGIYDGVEKEISATQRYKMLGNAISVPVVKAVGESIIDSGFEL